MDWAWWNAVWTDGLVNKRKCMCHIHQQIHRGKSLSETCAPWRFKTQLVVKYSLREKVFFLFVLNLGKNLRKSRAKGKTEVKMTWQFPHYHLICGSKKLKREDLGLGFGLFGYLLGLSLSARWLTLRIFPQPSFSSTNGYNRSKRFVRWAHDEHLIFWNWTELFLTKIPDQRCWEWSTPGAARLGRPFLPVRINRGITL